MRSVSANWASPKVFFATSSWRIVRRSMRCWSATEGAALNSSPAESKVPDNTPKTLAPSSAFFNLMGDLPKITLLSLQISQSPNSRLSGHSLAFATGAPDTDRNISLRFWLVQHRVRTKCLIISSPMRTSHECARQSTIRLWRDSLRGWIL